MSRMDRSLLRKWSEIEMQSGDDLSVMFSLFSTLMHVVEIYQNCSCTLIVIVERKRTTSIMYLVLTLVSDIRIKSSPTRYRRKDGEYEKCQKHNNISLWINKKMEITMISQEAIFDCFSDQALYIFQSTDSVYKKFTQFCISEGIWL